MNSINAFSSSSVVYPATISISLPQKHTEKSFVRKPTEPVYIKKMVQHITKMEAMIQQQKKATNVLEKDFLTFKKSAISFIENIKKQSEKKPRKPSGFVLPVPISNELADFLGEPHGSQKSRTEVTKCIIKYISDNKLMNPVKKTQVVPDEKLKTLLGSTVDFENLTRFNIQKYMNRHFFTQSIVKPL